MSVHYKVKEEIIQMGKKLNQSNLISRFKRIHGTRYNYDKVQYVNLKGSVRIRCQEHGVFHQIARNHLHGAGCPACSSIRGSRKIKNRIRGKLIFDFTKVHGDRYDYSRVNYATNKVKIEIVCSVHGSFLQQASHHKNGHGCPECSTGKLDISANLKHFKETHGERYNYSLVDFSRNVSDEKVTIVCDTHGKFETTMTLHKNGAHCPNCSRLERVLPANAVLRRLKKHGLTLVDQYQGTVNKHTLKCVCCSHEWNVNTLSNVLYLGSSCKVCNPFVKRGFDGLSNAILYYIQIGLDKYKIGITNRNVNMRFTTSDLLQITPIRTWRFKFGADARRVEQYILKRFYNYRYKGIDILSSGNTEIFTEDVLELDFSERGLNVV